MAEFTIAPEGPFSLRESAEFGFGQRDAIRFEGVMRLAFVVDGYADQIGVALRQPDPDGPVLGRVTGDADPAAVTAQVARVLSLDRDAAGFVAVGERDPVIGRLQALAHGLRPPLFHSAYEAAAWAVLSARRPAKQMAAVRDRLSAAHGTAVEVAGETMSAFPTPSQLLRVESFPGLQPEKMERLHGIAAAALEGRLDVARLVALGPEAAGKELLQLKGIGAFYASLVVIRALGFADVPVLEEPRAMALVGDLYDLGGPATPERMQQLSQTWQPFRTWTTVLIRAAGPRLLESRVAG